MVAIEDCTYLDVTDNFRGISLAIDIALQIRAKIKSATGLNASAGISYNKFLCSATTPTNVSPLSGSPAWPRPSMISNANPTSPR